MGSILLYTRDFSTAKQGIENLGGRVTHRFSDSTIVANFPTLVNFQNLKNAYHTPQRELDKSEKRLIQAYNTWKSEPSQAPRSLDSLILTSPCACNEKDGFNSGVNFIPDSGISPACTSRYMKGEIALILVVVSGTSTRGDDYKLSEDEENKILQEVIKGANFLANAEPKAKVTFRYYVYFQKVTADLEKEAGGDEYERKEGPWRDAALYKMGYAPGLKGINKLTNEKVKCGSEWGYVSFFTKFPVYHFAYTRKGQQHLVIESKNGKWGIDYINKVFAHETCHIFGAMDEYDSASNDLSGTLLIPNGNSLICPSQESCLMNSKLELVLCKYSRGQLGWPFDLLDDLELKEQAQRSLQVRTYVTIKEKLDAAGVSSIIGDYSKAAEFYDSVINDPECTQKDRQESENERARVGNELNRQMTDGLQPGFL
jgi:hypothetical protein